MNLSHHLLPHRQQPHEEEEREGGTFGGGRRVQCLAWGERSPGLWKEATGRGRGAVQLPMAARVLSGRRLADRVPRLTDGRRGRHWGRRLRGEGNRGARERRPRGRGRACSGAELPSVCARVPSARTAGAGGGSSNPSPCGSGGQRKRRRWEEARAAAAAQGILAA